MPPLRQATRRYPDLASFLAEHQSTLSSGALLLPADQAGGELAPEIKLDLVLPLVGRVGPVLAQVVARLPDGSVALRLPEIPATVEAGFRKVYDAIDEVERHLVASGALVPKEEVDALWAEIDALREALAGQAGAGPATAASDPELESAQLGSEALAPPEEELTEEPVTVPAPEEPADLDLESMVPSEDGALGDASLRRALVALALARRTGVLRTQNGEGQVRVGYWREGGPVSWQTDPPNDDEALGSLLLRTGQINEEQLAAAWATMERTGCRTGDALVRIGALQAQQLPLVLTRQAEFVLMRVLQEKSGDWAFYELDELPRAFEAPPAPVVAALLRAYVNQARRVQAPQLRGALKRHLEAQLSLKPEAILALRDFRYGREEAAVLDALRAGGVSVAALLDRGPAPFEVVAPLLWALLELGLTETGRKEGREGRPAAAGPDERGTKVAGLIATLQAQVGRSNPFAVLDLHWICTGEEVQRAVERLQRDLGLATAGELPPELARAAREVLGAVEAAAAVLGDPQRRRAARRGLVAPEDMERAIELLRAAAEEARQAGDRARAALAEARAEELAAG